MVKPSTDMNRDIGEVYGAETILQLRQRRYRSEVADGKRVTTSQGNAQRHRGQVHDYGQILMQFHDGALYLPAV